ncbi:hypothetical protein AVEN_189045-1 [Araneus ventricosus]|uniref:Uncharacterized protein n=1 Tax=Araneus ventricosus TaxID=182803 RepID=A0A4Y2S8R9_ARAVE|nr:hypothetical protein AVEN_189045-1 [Araneus ventricosus]
MVKDTFSPSELFKIIPAGRRLSVSRNRILQVPTNPHLFERQPVKPGPSQRRSPCSKNEIMHMQKKVPIKKVPGFDGIDLLYSNQLVTYPEISSHLYQNVCHQFSLTHC